MNKILLNDALETISSCKKELDFIKDSCVLITGATGMIGQQIINVLCLYNEKYNGNIKITAVIRDINKANKLWSDKYRKNIHFIICDFKNETILTEKADYIIHTAASTGDSRNHINYPVNTIQVAINSINSVLEMAKNNKSLSVILLSTLEVYGTTDINLYSIKEQDYGYIDILNIRSCYPESKRLCETLGISYLKQYNVPLKIARLSATFGAGVKYADNRVFAQFAKSVIENNDIILKSTGETIRNYCYVSDAVSAIFKILIYGNSGEAYNVANMDTSISIKDMAELVLKLYPDSKSKLKFDISKDNTETGYNSIIIKNLNSEKLSKLGWFPKVSLEEMFIRTIEYMKQCRF